LKKPSKIYGEGTDYYFCFIIYILLSLWKVFNNRSAILFIRLETFELEILKEYKEDKNFHRKTASFIQYIRDIIRSKNNQLFDQLILKGLEYENQAPPEVAAHINNDGIMVKKLIYFFLGGMGKGE
jgi:hypothetical protein